MTNTEIKTDDGIWKMKVNMMLKIKAEMVDCHGRDTEIQRDARFQRDRDQCAGDVRAPSDVHA